MMITVIHIRDYKDLPYQVYCGRRNGKLDLPQSVFANPFYMKDESKRDEVCDKYNDYFNKMCKQSLMGKELWILANVHIEYGKLELACYCAPKRCHCDAIKRHLEEHYA